MYSFVLLKEVKTAEINFIKKFISIFESMLRTYKGGLSRFLEEITVKQFFN